MQRRDFLTQLLAAGAVTQLPAQTSGITFERPGPGTPHKGKVLAAIQPHSDDVPIYCSGTVAKLLQEGYTGYMIRATNDDMGDDVGEPGTIGENVLRNERETDELTKVMGLQRKFDLNYNNHRMAGISQTELQLRLIFLIRLLKVDTVFCYDPWGHDEENPDHYVLGHCVEAACWMAGREHDYPEQFAAGLKTHAVSEKYYYARHPQVTRVVDISAVVDKKVEANRCNRPKGPGGGTSQSAKAIPLPCEQPAPHPAAPVALRDGLVRPTLRSARRPVSQHDLSRLREVGNGIRGSRSAPVFSVLLKRLTEPNPRAL